MWWWCGRGNQGSLIRLIGRLWHCYLAEMLPFCLCLRLGLIREFFVLTLFKIGMIGKYCWIVKSLFMFDDFMLAFVRERSLKPSACFSWFQGIDKETHSQTFFSHSYTVNTAPRTTWGLPRDAMALGHRPNPQNFWVKAYWPLHLLGHIIPLYFSVWL